jgi:hypothetical protein
MYWLALALVLLFAAAAPVDAQDRPAAGINREQGAPGSAGPKTDGVVQRGQQPNPAEVRPGNRDGDAPSAAAGEVVARPEARIVGLPVTAALVLGAVLLAMLVVAGVAIPAARRRERPQGGGTYGRQ